MKLLPTLLTAAAILAVPAAAGAMDIRPDPQSTEGSVRIDGKTIAEDCGHAKEHRGAMTKARTEEVQIRYGLPTGHHPDYEIDHLIPLCLGGADDPDNLWPQPRETIEPVWNAEKKDKLERRVCAMVCRGQVDLGTAQEDIATDWIAAYRKYLSAP